MDFRKFSKDFGVLFGRHSGEAFQVAGFTLRIRATRGRSTGEKWRPKSIFARCFCYVFCEGVFASISGRYFEARHLKNQ